MSDEDQDQMLVMVIDPESPNYQRWGPIVGYDEGVDDDGEEYFLIVVDLDGQEWGFYEDQLAEVEIDDDYADIPDFGMDTSELKDFVNIFANRAARRATDEDLGGYLDFEDKDLSHIVAEMLHELEDLMASTAMLWIRVARIIKAASEMESE